MSKSWNVVWYLLNAGLWLLLLLIVYRLPEADYFYVSLGGLVLVANVIGMSGVAGLLRNTFQRGWYVVPWSVVSEISSSGVQADNRNSSVIERRFLGWFDRLNQRAWLVGLGLGHVASPWFMAFANDYTGPTLPLIWLTLIFLWEAGIAGLFLSELGCLPVLFVLLLGRPEIFETRISSWLQLKGDVIHKILVGGQAVPIYLFTIASTLAATLTMLLPLAFSIALLPGQTDPLTIADGRNYRKLQGIYHLLCLTLIAPLFALIRIPHAILNSCVLLVNQLWSLIIPKLAERDDPESTNGHDIAGDIPIQESPRRENPVSFSSHIKNSAILYSLFLLIIMLLHVRHQRILSLSIPASTLLSYVGLTALVACFGLILFAIVFWWRNQNYLKIKSKSDAGARTTSDSPVDSNERADKIVHDLSDSSRLTLSGMMLLLRLLAIGLTATILIVIQIFSWINVERLEKPLQVPIVDWLVPLLGLVKEIGIILLNFVLFVLALELAVKSYYGVIKLLRKFGSLFFRY